jgi:competence protein CoiA
LLTAKNQLGETVYIGDFARKEDVHRLKNGQFYCPVCGEKLVVKLGIQRISHFAHFHLSTTCAEYERESEYHMRAKLQLYHWLKTQSSNVELEVFLPEIKQRPDLMFTFQGKRYCVEYQCSSISVELFEKRSKGYLTNGMIPLWILGGNRIQRKQTNSISISKFQSLFLKRNQTGDWYLPSYCPTVQSFITLSNLHPLSPQTMQCDYELLPLYKQHLSQWLNPSIQSTFHVSSWRKGIQQAKDNMIRFQSPKIFLQELYVNRLHLHLLPPYVGVPLRHNLILETSPIIWQMYIIFDNLIFKEVGILLTYDHVYKRFINRIERNHIKIRTTVKPTEKQFMTLISDYFFLLTKCQILKEIRPNHYRYVNKLSFPNNLMEAMDSEDHFYNNLIREKIVWY